MNWITTAIIVVWLYQSQCQNTPIGFAGKCTCIGSIYGTQYSSGHQKRTVLKLAILCFTKSSQQLNHPDWLEYEYKCAENVRNGWCTCAMQCMVHVQHLHVTRACIYKRNWLLMPFAKNYFVSTYLLLLKLTIWTKLNSVFLKYLH